MAHDQPTQPPERKYGVSVITIPALEAGLRDRTAGVMGCLSLQSRSKPPTLTRYFASGSATLLDGRHDTRLQGSLGSPPTGRKASP